MNTLEQVKAIIGDFAGIDSSTIADDAEIVNLGPTGMDSLDRIELAMKVGEHFDIDIPDDAVDLPEMGTPAGLAAYVDRGLAENAITAPDAANDDTVQDALKPTVIPADLAAMVSDAAQPVAADGHSTSETPTDMMERMSPQAEYDSLVAEGKSRFIALTLVRLAHDLNDWLPDGIDPETQAAMNEHWRRLLANSSDATQAKMADRITAEMGRPGGGKTYQPESRPIPSPRRVTIRQDSATQWSLMLDGNLYEAGLGWYQVVEANRVLRATLNLPDRTAFEPGGGAGSAAPIVTDDNPEWSEADFAAARPASEVHGAEVAVALTGPRFRKRPIEIEAARLLNIHGGTPLWAINDIIAPQWLVDAMSAPEGDQGAIYVNFNTAPGTLSVNTLEGPVTAQPGDWIVRGAIGEVYPVKPDIFAMTYDPAGVGEEESENKPTDADDIAPAIMALEREMEILNTNWSADRDSGVPDTDPQQQLRERSMKGLKAGLAVLCGPKHG